MARHRRNLSVAKGIYSQQHLLIAQKVRKLLVVRNIRELCLKVKPEERVLHAIHVRTTDGPQFAQVYVRVSKFLTLTTMVYSRI